MFSYVYDCILKQMKCLYKYKNSVFSTMDCSRILNICISMLDKLINWMIKENWCKNRSRPLDSYWHDWFRNTYDRHRGNMFFFTNLYNLFGWMNSSFLCHYMQKFMNSISFWHSTLSEIKLHKNDTVFKVLSM